MESKTREIGLISAIVVLAAIVVIQSVTNSQLLSLIGQQPQRLSLHFLSTIMDVGRRLQQQIAGQTDNNTGIA